MAKSSSLTLEPKVFGDFTRERIEAILKGLQGSKSEIARAVAASALASLDPHGPNPSSAFIATALDVLAQAGTSSSGDLLWQAAQHARNARIRVEAIRRFGPFAESERRVTLRKWAAEGFQPSASFQNDPVTPELIREASLTALGQVEKPTEEDIAAIITALTPAPGQDKFSQRVFDAAAEAYWRIGDAASLPKLVEVVSNRPRAEAGLSLTSLAAKFTMSELAPHADRIRKALHHHAPCWQDDAVRVPRLAQLAQKVATAEFLQEWASSFGRDGLQSGRGKITSTLLEKFDKPSERAAEALLILAQWPQNLSPQGAVVQGLTRCARAGHGGARQLL